MKNYKLINPCLVLLIITLLPSMVSWGQSFVLKGGPAYSKLVAIEDGENIFEHGDKNTDSYGVSCLIASYNAGASYYFRLSELFQLETGLFLSGKGLRINEFERYTDIDYNHEYSTMVQLRMFNADIPILAKVNFRRDKFKCYGKLGGTIGVTLAGNLKFTQEDRLTYGNSDYLNQSKYDVGIDLEHFEERVNAGPLIGIGVELKRYFIEFDYGVSIFGNKLWNADVVYNHNLYLSLGIMFNRPQKTEK